MELKLEPNLIHQTIPVEGVATVVEASMQEAAKQSHQNPRLQGQLNGAALRAVRQQANIEAKAIKQRVRRELLPDAVRKLPHHHLLDIKMETGTGKTYVYTRTLFELHKRCGFNKFIIAVPTLPIKAGVAAFLNEPEAKRHFESVCGYNAEIELCLLEPQKQKKKGRLNMPTAVGHFFWGTHHVKRKIYVLLLNTQLIANGKLLTRDDYDQMLGEFHRPADAIADTKPVLIIDEPHRVERSGKSYAALIENFRPQLVLRYGATFPEITLGKGKNKQSVKDYQELIYDLSAADSFNQGLIKGVAKEHLELPGGKKAEKKVKVLSVVKGDNAKLRLTRSDSEARTFTVHVGDSLGMIDDDLDGVVVEAITKNGISLSNGQEKLVGEEFFPDQYGVSYQEAMMELALMRHFETERENFCREGLPIKTLALFFIDNIESFRGAEGQNDGWLRRKFLEVLERRVRKELARQNTPAYAAYLEATLNHLEASCAGYFSQDNNKDSDEGIASEVKVILHGKKELLSFTDKEGKPNVLRFLFSKWTLKEGWDNPNVFTICKLRSSGSEVSKLQEVGRGLRLPVDSEGNRISAPFLLNYIVDFTERDFANKLVAEINGDLRSARTEYLSITSEDIIQLAEARGIDPNHFFIELMTKGYVDFNKDIVPDKFDDLLMEYPELRDSVGGVSASRIINRNSSRNGKVHIRKAKFEELRELWSQLNRKYVLFFDQEIDQLLASSLPQIILNKRVLSVQAIESSRSLLGFKGNQAVSKEDSHAELTVHHRHYAYNEFLKQASRHTHIPVLMLHQAICQAAKSGMKVTDEMFNDGSLARLVAAVDDWKCEQLVGFVRYKQANYRVKETKLTHPDGTVRDEVVQAYIGRKCVAGEPPVQYLYDAYAHDSGLELQNIKTEVDEVVVYGKIPSHSICIPTVASSNYSPDFMYVVKKSDGTKELNVVIETKAYDRDSHISPDEETKISCAEAFFEAMTASGYTVHFRKQINGTGIRKILDELVAD